MIKRVLTAVVGLPFVLFLVHIGGLPLLIACAGLAIIGLRELYLAFSKTHRPVHFIGYGFTVLYFAAIYVFGAGYWLLIALTLFIITAQTGLVVFFKRLTLQEIITTVYGFLYVPFLLSFIVLVREHALGWYYVWLIFIASMGSDTFAYLTGVSIGRRKLTGSPSPSKSLEGVFGGVIGATFVGVLYGFVLAHFFSVQGIMLNAAVICFIGGIFSVIGDMAASAVKRHMDIKDFGNVFPGHGGVLDRVDSVVIVAPIVYMAMNILIWLVV